VFRQQGSESQALENLDASAFQFIQRNIDANHLDAVKHQVNHDARSNVPHPDHSYRLKCHVWACFHFALITVAV
jgi:hypothetical protein